MDIDKTLEQLKHHGCTILVLTAILVPSIWKLESIYYCGQIDTLKEQNNLLIQKIAFMKDMNDYQKYTAKMPSSKLQSEIAKFQPPPKGSAGKLIFSQKSAPQLKNGILSIRIPNLQGSVLDLSISALAGYHVIEKNGLTKIEEDYINKLLSNNLTTYDEKNTLLTIPGFSSAKLTGYILTWR